ncbi:hypothetical protein PMZ80_007551 [Knufia obscura]|uniref:BTB domain-containing protein n=2 Tax=Knufia TaxID=430999 RepID=A0AAN8I4H9_9EURO|nr:hypothetical protein PMZ80_007551 [Knufia obscura]KAK5954092.1 hypothetical protein OHC33_004664 [Knufia fluminis]
MVSHAEIAESSRRAPSVTSRSSRNRHHQSRTRHGAPSYPSQNEFPFFAQTGDVEIVVECDGQEKRYLLHRLMLAQFSGFFDAGMSDEWSRTHAQLLASEKRPEQAQALSIIGEEHSGSEVSGSASTPYIIPEQASRTASSQKRWRYELNWATVNDDEEPILVQKAPQYQQFTPTSAPPPVAAQARPKPPSSTSHSFFRSMANLSRPSHVGHASQSAANLSVPPDPALSNPLIRDYDNLFRSFYNYAPILNTVNIASAYGECKSLLGLADMYDALGVVGPRVEHHLLAFSSRLFKQIAKYPPSYLKLGYLARSKVIFSEALTHVVGQWPAAQPYLKPGNAGTGYEVPLAVLDLIEDKVDELEETKSKVEAKLFRLTLTTSRGERVNPSNDYLGWLAMSLFRQWIAENTTPEVRGILKNTGNANASRPGSNQSAAPPSATQTSLPAQPQAQQAQQPPAPAVQTGKIYRLIGNTNAQSYLPHEELKRFLKLQPVGTSSGSGSSLYTRDNLRRFERKMDQLKNIARDMVKPLTRNCLELDVRAMADGQGGGLGYLTCVKVEEEDIPW